MDLKQITLQVCRIAQETGHYLAEERKVFQEERVQQKQAHDYVSYVDREAEVRIVRELKALLPEAGFLTEEGTVEQTETDLKWVIDPLDGTTNYTRNHAPYCVCIALQKGVEFLIGVVYEVCRNECYYAWQGGGSFLNGEKIHVSDKPMEDAFIGIDLPYQAEDYKPVIIKTIDKLYGRVASLRLAGSAAMGLCYVAAGRYDGWSEAFIKPWDYAAGVVIAREAGAQVTDFFGNEELDGTHHIIVTNGIIHRELQETVKTVSSEQ